MKRFIFKVVNTTKNPSIYGGRKQKAIVYKIGRKGVEYLGETRTWTTASYRGAKSEVNQWLLINKYIPYSWSKGYDFQEQHKKGKTTYTPYFNYNDKYEIIEI